MDYVGIDLHKKESQICSILSEGGQLSECRIRTEPQRFAEVFGGRPRARILLEASTAQEGNFRVSPFVDGGIVLPALERAAAFTKTRGAAPAIARHPTMHGEIRPHWHWSSTVFNTDAQIFSDAGIPVILLMEHYDIDRKGYHDTHDTLENIDLDFGAAVVSIAKYMPANRPSCVRASGPRAFSTATLLATPQ